MAAGQSTSASPQNFDVCVTFFCGVPMPGAHQRVGVWPATGKRHGRSGR
jgi:hypothetical protein